MLQKQYMAFTITHIEDLEIIEVSVEGKLSQDLRKEILLASVNELKKANYKRLFIDLSQTLFDTETPLTGALTLITYIRSLGLPPQAKMAFLYSDSETHRRFFESVAQSEGYQLRYFCNGSQTIEWLYEG